MRVPARNESTTETLGEYQPPTITDSSRKGTSSLASAGLTSQLSMPQALAEVMRRLSSWSLSSVRATSIPPEVTLTCISSYCSWLSRVRWAISLLWSTGKMKFEAWPVDPPGLGRGPLSTCTMSRQPRAARCLTTELPTMPAPITTTRALAGRSLIPGSCSSCCLVSLPYLCAASRNPLTIRNSITEGSVGLHRRGRVSALDPFPVPRGPWPVPRCPLSVVRSVVPDR